VADAEHVGADVALTAARAAFDEGPRPKISGRERARILHKAAGLVGARAGEIVRLQSLAVVLGVRAGRPGYRVVLGCPPGLKLRRLRRAGRLPAGRRGWRR
jgi:hypothetical protein